jgi:broad specificity phosphatase PhoE
VYNDRDFSLHPKRIILIRHAQSQGNVDSSLYSRVPDAQLELTDRGRLQAQEAGVKLKELIGDESCGVYMSPYARSRQTSHEIIKGLSKEQVIHNYILLYLLSYTYCVIGDNVWIPFQHISLM